MTIRIVTDSTCDLPVEFVQKHNIIIIPCYINFEGKSYLDMVDLSRQEFYARIAKLDTFPKTSAPGAGFFENYYHQVAAQGADEIISIHIGGGLSNLSNVARLAAEEFKKIKVTVIQVGQVALALGFLVAAAAKAVAERKSVTEIQSLLQDMDKRTYTYAALDTLEFLKHGGRVPHLLVDLASLLNIKPVILLHLGSISMADRIRTASRQIDVLVKHILQQGPLEELGVVHTNAPEKANELLKALRTALNFTGDIWTEEATPILGVHVGPRALGVACVRAG